MSTSRAQIKALVESRPELNQTEIAGIVGVSRERVRQIVKAEGLQTRKGVSGVGRRRSPGGRPRVLTGGVPVPICTVVAGTIGEVLAAADLMARGLTVFYPFLAVAMCDLITLDTRGEVERIEVRCGIRRGKSITYKPNDKNRSDRLAIVVTGEPVIYVPPFPGDITGGYGTVYPLTPESAE